jgi:hypothetical protein
MYVPLDVLKQKLSHMGVWGWGSLQLGVVMKSF